MALYDTHADRRWHRIASAVAFSPNAKVDRISWADLAKGLSILLVVLMHSTLGVGEEMKATGWTHAIVAFAKPFRMPDFFLVAGLFASAALSKPLLRFIDSRVIHFAYFYILWVFLTVLAKGVAEHGADPGLIGSELASALYEPHSSLWFIYILPMMFLALRALAALPPAVALLAAGALHVVAMMHQDGGAYALSANMTRSFAVDSFSLFFVFFLAGHIFRSAILQLAAVAQARPALAAGGLVVWAAINGAAVATGAAQMAALGLPLGLAGALAVVVLSALLARVPAFHWLAALGRQSLVVYLSFTIPMAATRILLLKTGVISDVGWVSAVTFLVALLAPLVLARLVKDGPSGWLYRRPGWARLG